MYNSKDVMCGCFRSINSWLATGKEAQSQRNETNTAQHKTITFRALFVRHLGRSSQCVTVMLWHCYGNIHSAFPFESKVLAIFQWKWQTVRQQRGFQCWSRWVNVRHSCKWHFVLDTTEPTNTHTHTHYKQIAIIHSRYYNYQFSVSWENAF